MTISFDKISKLMLSEMDGDSRLANMNKFIAKDLLSDFIINSATVDFYKCPKCNDDSKYVEYQSYEKEIICSSDNATLTTQLDEVSPTIGLVSGFAIINGESLSSNQFSYDSVTNTITINIATKSNDIISVGWEREGYFEDLINGDLNRREQYIIALGAYLCYLQQFINSENQLKVQVGDKDYKTTPNYLLLNSVLGVSKEKRQRLDKLISDYYYENINPDILR